MAKKKRQTYVIATIRDWNIDQFKQLVRNKKAKWVLIKNKRELTLKRLKALQPRYVFFPHWSWIIPEEICNSFECIGFHMTDLPFGRGGSPLQNLLARGIYRTKISAFRVVKKLDAGPIYKKKSLTIKDGSAEEIFKKVARIVFKELIPNIIKYEPVPKKQVGKKIVFKRRTPQEGNMISLSDLNSVYDYIRMLDAPGYPSAFLLSKRLCFEFSGARKTKEGIKAQVLITRKGVKK